VKRYEIVFLIGFTCFAGGRTAIAQNWTAIAVDTPTNRTPYFLDTNVGFLYTPGLICYNQLLLTGYSPDVEKTTNGGVAWQYLPFFDSIGCSITDMSFASAERGYVSAYAPHSSVGGIYETTDQGIHWKRISLPGSDFSGVYAVGTYVFAFENTTHIVANSSYFGTDGTILFTNNDGSRWDSIGAVAGLKPNSVPQFQGIYGNRDSLVATVYFDDSSYGNGGENTYLVYSTNLGRTWQSSFLDSTYKFGFVSLLVQPHSCRILRLRIDSVDFVQGSTTFLVSNLPYSVWDTSLTGYPTNMWAFGTSCAWYIPEGSKTFTGGVAVPPFQSTRNSGTSWTEFTDSQLGFEPFDFVDYYSWRDVAIVGYGAVVFATDDYRQLLKTSNGGDGTMSATQLAPRIEFGSSVSSADTISMNECSPSSFYINFQNLACAITSLQSIDITGLDSTEFSYTLEDHSNCTELPDTAFITLNPHKTGIYSLSVNSHFMDDEFHTFDTTIKFTIIIGPGTTPTMVSLSIDTKQITTAPGDTLDILVYLSGNTNLDSTFISLPFVMDTNVLRPLEFYPLVSDMTVDSSIYFDGTETVPIRMAGRSLNSRTEIGVLKVLVYLTPIQNTSIYFTGPSINVKNASCTELSQESDSIAISISACGDQTLRYLMETDSLPPQILSIFPNPVSGMVSINFLNARSESLSYTVFDAIGAIRMTGVTSGSSISLDATLLPDGMYFFRVQNQDGFQDGKEFIVKN
jgi:Secretion system C-terminal sorting domain